ncbi:MAG: hypothetical protein M4579_006605 [Chaenotheca gracillima]|nr:MAG: hypothetical protein M4579_006605 [Chaenotheca gracillima]
MGERSTWVTTPGNRSKTERGLDEPDTPISGPYTSVKPREPHTGSVPHKTQRKRHRVGGSHGSSSSVSVDKDRRRRALQDRSRNVRSGTGRLAPTSTGARQSEKAVGTVNSGLEPENWRFFPFLPRWADFTKTDERNRPHKRVPTTHSPRSSSASTLEDRHSDRRMPKPMRKSGLRPSTTSQRTSRNLTSPSVVSNLTAISGSTNTSSGSSGSNSTVTQHSISRQRRPPPPPIPQEEPADTQNNLKCVTKSSAKSQPDVFAFLDTGPASPPAQDTGPFEFQHGFEPDHARHYSGTPGGDSADNQDHHSSSPTSSSFHSDSGISVRGDSPERPRPSERPATRSSFRTKAKAPVNSSAESTSSYQHASVEAAQDSDRDSFSDTELAAQSTPYAAQLPFNRTAALAQSLSRAPAPPFAPEAPPTNEHYPPYLWDSQTETTSTQDRHRFPQVPTTSSRLSAPMSGSMEKFVSSVPKATASDSPKAGSRKSGYDFLASSLCSPGTTGSGDSNPVVPLYRKFEALNHRLFLHLQDEIVELEEELSKLDEMDARLRTLRAGRRGSESQPDSIAASRRSTAKLDNGLDWKRTEVMGAIFNKLGFYNQALCSYGKLVRNLDPACQEDIERYRAWMKQHRPIVESETGFLENESDLLSVGSRASTRAQGDVCASIDGGSTAQHFTSILAAAVLLPVLTFVVVPGFLARVFIILLVAGSALAMASSHENSTNVLGGGRGKRAAIYVGVMSVIAGVLR